jgi:16S rRNA (guanine1207-N2)-methyltransferase
LLIDALDQLIGPRVLTTTAGQGQFPAAAAHHGEQAGWKTPVLCHTYDDFLSRRVRNATFAAPFPEVVCGADFPPGEFDSIALAVDHRAATELTRDVVQSGAISLRDGGRMLAAVGKADDTFLHDELKKYFPKVTRNVSPRGVLYMATKAGPPKKVKNFAAEFTFKDGERVIRLVSRPGVFSHREIDDGARALLRAIEVAPGKRVIDMGCGSGAVALGLAARDPSMDVLAIDSHARALWCVEQGMKLNELSNVRLRLTSAGDVDQPGTYDILAGNPPYFSDYRIATLFLETARLALKRGGRVFMVTKSPHWFEEAMGTMFGSVEPRKIGEYYVVSAKKR